MYQSGDYIASYLERFLVPFVDYASDYVDLFWWDAESRFIVRQ